MKRSLQVVEETFPIAGSFTISRGSRTDIPVISVTIIEGENMGSGECVPYSHYGESLSSVRRQIENMSALIADGGDRADLNKAMPAGAARNAIDCALLDLEAKQTGRRAWEILDLLPPPELVTAYTLSLGSAEAMGAAAREARERALLKLKLGGEGDIERVRAVREGAPNSRLIVDANEAWSQDMVQPYSEAFAEMGVELIEQPLPSGHDELLAAIPHPVPICADESCHVSSDLNNLTGRYDLVNIKLDKTGGLTEALNLARAARAKGFNIMVGCMLGTSLAMAPAILVATLADFVDLDGPLLLSKDRDEPLVYRNSHVMPPEPELWG